MSIQSIIEIIQPGFNRCINYYYNFDGAPFTKLSPFGGTRLRRAGLKGARIHSLKYLVTPYGRAVKNGSSWIYEYNLTDHLGNVRVVIRKGANNLAEVVQERHYYPYGMEMSELSYNFGSTVPNKYLYNGKELENDYGIYLYDYGARFYDPVIGRWGGVDPLAEKYYCWSPYVYVLSNPIILIDPDGRELRVAKEYQEQFKNDLRNVFGDRTNMLSFNDNGTLQLDGKTKDFTKGMTNVQKDAFKGLNKAMSDKQVTSVVYADNYNVTVDNEIKSVDIVQEYGGGLYSKTDNLIVIAPNVGSVDVKLDKIQITADEIGFPTQNVQQNTTSTLFHEIGERNTINIIFRGAVIDFENYARRAIGLPVRPYDLNHSKTIKTNYTK